MTAPELKPCPFCGGKPEVYKPTPVIGYDDDDTDWLRIECSSCWSTQLCELITRQRPYKDALVAASARWNTRSDLIIRRDDPVLGKIVASLEDIATRRRGMLGIDAEEDCRWAMAEAHKVLAALQELMGGGDV